MIAPLNTATGHQLNKRLAVRFRQCVFFVSVGATSTCWAVGMGSSMAFEGGGDSGIGGLVGGVFLIALAVAWMLGKQIAAAVYLPTIIGALLLTPLSWYVTGRAPWERDLGPLSGFLFVCWLVGFAALWFWMERKKGPEQEPPGTD